MIIEAKVPRGIEVSAEVYKSPKNIYKLTSLDKRPPLPGEIDPFYKGNVNVVEPVPNFTSINQQGSDDQCPTEELSCILSLESLSVKVAPPYKLGSNVCTDVPKTYTVSEPDCLDDMNMTQRSGEAGLGSDSFKLKVINKFVCFYNKCSVPLEEFLASLPNYLRKTSPEATLNPRVFAQSETVLTPISQPKIEPTPTPLNAQALKKLEEIIEKKEEKK